MGDCWREAHGDDHHHHHHHHHDHDHDHSHDDPERGREFSLFQYIDYTKARVMNASDPDSFKHVFKPFHERLDTSTFVESDCDEQLIFYIPFTGTAKLKSIALYSEHGDASPATMKAYINRDDIDFDTVEGVKATQEWELAMQENEDHIEYPTRITKFSSCRSLTLYFPKNFGDDVTKMFYIGLKGEFKTLNKDPIITVYEVQASKADHPNEGVKDSHGGAIC